MNQDRLAGMWKQFRGKVKGHWGKLTHNALVQRAGTRDQFDGRMQERVGMSKEKAAREIKDFLDRNRDASNR